MYFDYRLYDKVDKMRLEKGWSIYHLAELSNVSVNTLYSWRDRGSSPTLYLIENIAKAFDVNPISLLLQDEELAAIEGERKQLLELWDNLSHEQKDSLIKMIRSFIRED